MLAAMSPTRSTRRRPLAPAGWLLAGVLALTGCSGSEEPATPAGIDSTASPTEAAVAPEVSPLTGLPLKGKAPRHPVLAVKVDNSASSAPQLGLGAADMVVEELVEGGMTRLAVFYYTRVPETVGPVRSMRGTDIGIVQPLGAALVASGGAPVTVERVHAAGIKTFTEGAPGYFRDSGRSAPYNLFMHLRELAGTVKATGPARPYLPFGEELPKGRRATGVTVSFSPSSSSTFAYRDGHYVNTDTNATAEDQFLADTVVVLRVPVGDAGYLDPAGNPVPETRFTGSGEASVFHGGRMVRGTWRKAGLDARVQLENSGKPVELPPGKVWIELVPADGGNLTVTR